jgi:uncharacterized protein YegJ (DUF2314 family)
MKRKTVASWVQSTITASSVQALLGGLGFLLLGGVVLLVTFWVIYVVVYLGFDWVLPHTHETRVWISFACLGLLFIANALTDRRDLERFSVPMGPRGQRAVTIYVPFVGMGSTVNPFSREYAGFAVKQLSALAISGPRAVVLGVRYLGQYFRFLRCDHEGCAAVLECLAASDEPVPFMELVAAIPKGLDAERVLSDVLLFDGVRLVPSEPMGLSLSSELRYRLRKRLGGGKKKASRKGKAAESSGPKNSLVLLFREPRDLDAELLVQVVNSTFGLELTTGKSDATEFVTGEEPVFFAQFAKRIFQILCVRKPYFDDLDAITSEIIELRLRKAVAEHRAWVSVDLMTDYPDADLRDPHWYIGNLLAALANGDTTAVVCPAERQMRAWDRNVLNTLRSDNPLDAFRVAPDKVPVIAIDDDDPRMLAAVEEARRRWPEFVAAFRQRQPGQKFAVKVPIRDDEDHTEYMWLTVLRVDDDQIHGKVDNEPVEVKSVRLGSKVTASQHELNDWIFVDGERMLGGFTVKLLQGSGEE